MTYYLATPHSNRTKQKNQVFQVYNPTSISSLIIIHFCTSTEKLSLCLLVCLYTIQINQLRFKFLFVFFYYFIESKIKVIESSN